MFNIFATQAEKANDVNVVYDRCYNNSNYHLFQLSLLSLTFIYAA